MHILVNTYECFQSYILHKSSKNQVEGRRGLLLSIMYKLGSLFSYMKIYLLLIYPHITKDKYFY